MANLSVTRAWNETSDFARRESGLILPVALLLFAVPSAALQIFMPSPPAPGQLPEVGVWLLLLPVAMIASLVGSLAISHLALRPGASVAEALQAGVRRFLPLFLASLLLGIAAVILMVPLAMILLGSAVASGNPAAAGGSLALFAVIVLVVAVAAWVRLMLITPLAAVEDLGPIALLRRSWDLTRGHFWRLLGLVLLVFVVGSILVFAVSAIVGIVVILLAGAPEPGSTTFILMTVIEALLSAVLSAVIVTLIARIYAQLAGSVPKDVFA